MAGARPVNGGVGGGGRLGGKKVVIYGSGESISKEALVGQLTPGVKGGVLA